MSLFYKLLLAPIVEAEIFCFLVVLQTPTSSPPKKTQQQQFGKFNITFQCFILKNMRKNLPMLYNNRICSPGYSGSQCFVRIFASWGGTSWYDSFHCCDSGLVWNVPFWRLHSFNHSWGTWRSGWKYRRIVCIIGIMPSPPWTWKWQNLGKFGLWNLEYSC